MALLDNAKWERFAQALAQGMTADEAYREAGYRPNRGNASTLKAKQIIQHRVAELQSRAASDVVVTRQWLLEQCVDIAKAAREDGAYAAAVNAIKEAGVLSGERVERQTQEHEGGVTVEIVRFTDDGADG